MSEALNLIGILTFSIAMFFGMAFLASIALNWLADFFQETFQLQGMAAPVLSVVIIFGGVGVVCFIAGKMVSV